ncbi:SCO family protein [Jeotgalibacillus sp. S-D1]|uniref:SCO family protein n=1 Tax=Jeotgalibacillus sp. S-D1 TaxID=2552189 RepID=UPI001F0FF785|nr:SCO family protein [Jeotgalibacillus sp. S-D1]
MSKKGKFVFVLLLAAIGLAACSPFQKQGPVVDNFTFINQHNEEFGLEQLEGKVWIADFIFTNCETICPPMTAKLAAVQKELKAKGLDIEIVSFSVDPEVDTPERLNDYLAKFTDDDSNWNLLTGYPQERIETFALDEFETLVNKPSGSDQVLHGVNFYIIDQDGAVVNEFSFTDPELIDKMVEEIEKYAS